jgi:two-component system, OmpR family, response regulator
MSTRLTIFIADDQPEAVATLSELLARVAGVEIVGSADSEMAAAEWLDAGGRMWDVLITDILLLPGGSGFGLIRHAKTLGKFRHVIVFSSFVTEAVAHRCIGLGADAVFRKSDLQALLQHIALLAANRALDRHQGSGGAGDVRPGRAVRARR